MQNLSRIPGTGYLLTEFRIVFFGTLRTDAMGKFYIGMVADILLYLAPVAFVITDFFT